MADAIGASLLGGTAEAAESDSLPQHHQPDPADGFRCDNSAEVAPAIQAFLASPKPGVLEAVVDAEEKPTKPQELRA